MTQLRVQLHLVGQLREHVSDRQRSFLDHLDRSSLRACPAWSQAERAAGLPRGQDNSIRALAKEELVRVPDVLGAELRWQPARNGCQGRRTRTGRQVEGVVRSDSDRVC